MKNSVYKLLIIIAVVLSSVIGCVKEDTSVPNQISFNSTNYSINSGYQSATDTIVNVLTQSVVYKFEVLLSGKGITYNSDSLGFIGKGNFLALTMYSVNSEYLEAGLYTFDRFASQDSLTMDSGVLGINADFKFEVDENYRDISSGVVKVVKSGNIYTIDFDVYTLDNKQIVGSFNGLLKKVIFKYDDVVEPPIDPTDESYFNIESTNYPLAIGSLNLSDEVSTNPSVFQYELDLCGPGITYDTNLEQYIGKGNVMMISLYSSTTDSLKTGTYVYDAMDQSPFIFDGSMVLINYDIDNQTDDGEYFIDSGNLKISREGDNYKIIFDFIDMDGVPVKGQFIGPLDYHDLFTVKKKTAHRPFKTRIPFRK